TRRDPRVEMIGRHVGNGLRAQQALAVERAAVEQHLAEPRVVHRGPDHAAAARLPALRQARVEEGGVGANGDVVREGLRDAGLLALSVTSKAVSFIPSGSRIRSFSNS